jgi:hypothetical protein
VPLLFGARPASLIPAYNLISNAKILDMKDMKAQIEA